MARRRVLVDARYATAAPTTSHARYVRELARCWADDSGALDVFLLTTRPPGSAVARSASVRWLAPPRLLEMVGRRAEGGRLWLNSVFTAASLRIRPDALFFPYPFVPRVLVAPTVVTIHDVCFIARPLDFGGGNLNTRVGGAVQRAARLITPSAASRDGVAAAYGVDPRQISVVQHGIASTFTAEPAAEDADVRSRYGLRAPYILCVSTHEPRKNIVTLARAHVALWRHLIDTARGPLGPDLVLVGRRSAYSRVVESILAEFPEAASHTRMLTSVSDAELAALYRGALATAVPSICEGFGFPLIEALACGCPALVADQPVFRELVAEAATYLAPLDVDAWTNALLAAAENGRGSHEAASARSEAMRTQYSWRATARETLSVLESVAR